MTNFHPADTWFLTERERMLQGLAAVLAAIEGVKFVSRQPLERGTLSQAQLPAIIISDTSVNMEWALRDSFKAHVRSSIVLDLQCFTPRSRLKGGTYAQSQVQEAFAGEVIRTLANNPMLKVQLSDEDKAYNHANDCMLELPNVQHLNVKAPYTRSMITLHPVETEEYLRETEPSQHWKSITLDIYPIPDEGDDPSFPGFNIDIENGYDPDN